MKIYTKTGDKGQTSLISGKRVPKNHDRIEAYGSTDELNSFIGLIIAQADTPDSSKLILTQIQNEIFVIGSHLANEPGKNTFPLPELDPKGTEKLEKEIDRMNEELEGLKNFVLPGGSQSIAFTHIARTVCRRAERNIVKLMHQEPVNENIVIYLNRMSDYLFTLSRFIAKKTGVEEIKWTPRS
jgi:cob(I)alamin adenosyltransferase